MRRREDKRQVDRRREATRNKVAAAVENFDDDVVFIKEVKRKISPATSSPPGFRNRRLLEAEAEEARAEACTTSRPDKEAYTDAGRLHANATRLRK